LEKSNITLHVCHCGQSVTVDHAPRELIQGIEKIAELNPPQQKQFSLRIITPGVIPESKGLRLAPE
jgi:hypothetical protein